VVVTTATEVILRKWTQLTAAK